MRVGFQGVMLLWACALEHGRMLMSMFILWRSNANCAPVWVLVRARPPNNQRAGISDHMRSSIRPWMRLQHDRD